MNYEMPASNETFRTALLTVCKSVGDVNQYVTSVFARFDNAKVLGNESHPSKRLAEHNDVYVDFVMGNDFEAAQKLIEALEDLPDVPYVLMFSMQDDDHPRPMLRVRQ